MRIHLSRANPESSQRGLSMVELMISITLGLLVLTGVVAIFTNNSRTRQEVERTSRQIENGRYASQLLADDIRMAGFFGVFDPKILSTASLSALPDACATDLATLRTALPIHVQGYDNGSTVPNCLSDFKSGTDILVIRRASTCINGVANCTAVGSGETYFQASSCRPIGGTTELAKTITNNPADYSGSYFALDTTPANLTLHKINCTTTADLRSYRTYIYFVANSNNSGDGIPTLKRWELGATANPVPLVEGIENLQFEYGIDTDCNGSPDVYVTDPASYTPVAANCAPLSGADSVSNWRNVVAIKFSLLARNTTATPGFSDAKSYVLGQNSDGSDNSVGPFYDAYKRHAYTQTVRLNNPAGRRE